MGVIRIDINSKYSFKLCLTWAAIFKDMKYDFLNYLKVYMTYEFYRRM